MSAASRERHRRPPAPDLFESKLQPPPTRSALVSRAGLVDRLLASTVPITSVVAPPGYGKTTLLSEWAQRDTARVAWLSIDRHDNDLGTLLSYTAAALDRVEPVDPELLRASGRSYSVASVASRVAGAMSGMKEPVVLVLDHVEALENDECLDTIAELALHLPSGSRLALATRGEPPLPMPRLRATRDVEEVGVDDLAMTQVEARLLLEGAGVSLTDADIDNVIARAEGWPVGLYLAALALKAGSSQQNAGVPFSGDDRLMAEYLRAEVLDRLSAEEVAFLTRTAVLDRMTGSLCDAVLGDTGSAEVLESLARSNLLLVPLDRQGAWYRYHRLFRDLLLAELQRREPALAPELHGRAAEWCAANGQPDAAIDHAQAGGDAGLVNRLLLVHGPTAYAFGRVTSLRRWLTWLDDNGLVEQYPAAALLGALFFSSVGRPSEAERWAAAVERPSREPIAPGGDSPAERAAPARLLPDGSSLESYLAIVRASLCRNGIEAMRRDAEVALAGLSARSGFRAAALYFEALSYALDDETERADPMLANAADVARQLNRMPSMIGGLATRGVIACSHDDWSGAEEFAAQALAVVDANDLDDNAESALAFALAGRCAAHGGKLDAARELLTRAARLRPLLTYARPAVSVLALLELAHAYVALGDTAGAREALRQSREVLQQRPQLGVLPAQVEALRARLDTMRTCGVGASSLTAAELRLVPLLTTHLTFPQIGERLFISRNTVKSQAISIYQKLGVSSRGEAIERLREIGLLPA